MNDGTKISYALNQIIVPQSSLIDLINLAKSIGVSAIEIRNDIPVNLIEENRPESIKTLSESNCMRILTVNALQKFNLWNEERLNELVELCKFSSVAGVEAIVLVPLNDGSVTDDIDQRELLGNSLKEIVKVLSDFDLLGYVEPLGFETSSVRKKSMVVDEIKKLKTSRLKIVHDTFHHFLAGEKDFFPSMTGLVHISGVSSEFSNIELNDNHRYLINETDMLGNINQINYFLQSDYKGFFSFEPFAKDLAKNDNLSNVIERNINYIEEQLSRTNKGRII
tara:strand:+ start:1032 stop:1871 length:840 start_codon:yes stop_codon:yes gene_type:complete